MEKSKQLTINPGLRYDWFHPWVAEQNAPQTVWVPERRFAAIDDMLSFKNWSPRVSVVYDLSQNVPLTHSVEYTTTSSAESFDSGGLVG